MAATLKGTEDYQTRRNAAVKLVDAYPFFSEALERVLKIEDFKEFRQKRKDAVDAYNSNAQRLIGIMDKADAVMDLWEKLSLLAPAYDESARVYRDYAVFDRSLSLPDGIAGKYSDKLKSYIKTALRHNVAAGLLSPGHTEAKEMELLRELATPKDFLSFESTKLIMEAAHEDVKTTPAKNKKRHEERYVYAEEYVLSGLGKEKCGLRFKGVLAALGEIIKYDALEDPEIHVSANSAMTIHNKFFGMLAKTMGDLLSRDLSFTDMLKVYDTRTELVNLMKLK